MIRVICLTVTGRTDGLRHSSTEERWEWACLGSHHQRPDHLRSSFSALPSYKRHDLGRTSLLRWRPLDGCFTEGCAGHLESLQAGRKFLLFRFNTFLPSFLSFFVCFCNFIIITLNQLPLI